MANKLFNAFFWSGKSFMQVFELTFLRILMAKKPVKPTKAEEEKKKKAYYAKARKKPKKLKSSFFAQKFW